MNVKKLIIFSIASLILLAVVSVCVVGYGYKASSDKMSAASTAFREKRFKEAKKLLSGITARDKANEDAVSMLARIAEFEGDYVGAAHFWKRACNLNPLNGEYAKLAANAAIVSGNDSVIISKYLGRGVENNPRFEFAAGLAFLRRADLVRFNGVLKKMRDDKSEYADILEGCAELRDSHIDKAFDFFHIGIKSTNPNVKSQASMGAAIASFMGGDSKKAEQYLKSADISAAPEISSDYHLLNAEIARSSGDFPRAIECIFNSLKSRPDNLDAILNCCELSFASGNSEAIKRLRAFANARTKFAIMLDNYLSAFEFTLEGNTAKAFTAIKNSGTLSGRLSARMLFLSLACRLANSSDICTAADALPEIDGKAAESVVRDLKAYLATRAQTASEIVEVSKRILKFSPNDDKAARAVMAWALEVGEWNVAGDIAENILKQKPNDTQAMEVVIAAQIGLGDYNRGFDLLAKQPNNEPVWQFYKAMMLVASGKSADALPIVSTLAADGRLGDAEAGKFGESFLENLDSARVAAFAKSIFKTNPSASFVITGRLKFTGGDYKGARADFGEALKLSPDNLSASEGVVDSLVALGDYTEAEKILSELLKKYPDSTGLAVRMSNVLFGQNPSAAVVYLKKLSSKNPDNASVKARYAQALLKSGDSLNALAAAREAKSADKSNRAYCALVLVECLESRSQYEEALKVFLELPAFADGTARAETLLAESIKTAPSKTYAKFLAESVLKVYPNSKVAQRVKKENEK